MPLSPGYCHVCWALCFFSWVPYSLLILCNELEGVRCQSHINFSGVTDHLPLTSIEVWIKPSLHFRVTVTLLPVSIPLVLLETSTFQTLFKQNDHLCIFCWFACFCIHKHPSYQIQMLQVRPGGKYLHGRNCYSHRLISHLQSLLPRLNSLPGNSCQALR